MRAQGRLSALSYLTAPLLSVAMLSSGGEVPVKAEEPPTKVSQTVRGPHSIHAALPADALNPANQLIDPVIERLVNNFIKKIAEANDIFALNPKLRNHPDYKDLGELHLDLSPHQVRALSLMFSEIKDPAEVESFLIWLKRNNKKDIVSVTELRELFIGLLNTNADRQTIVGLTDLTKKAYHTFSSYPGKAPESRIAARELLGLVPGGAGVLGLITKASGTETSGVKVAATDTEKPPKDPMTLAVAPMMSE